VEEVYSYAHYELIGSQGRERSKVRCEGGEHDVREASRQGRIGPLELRQGPGQRLVSVRREQKEAKRSAKATSG
jgi:hypothetical protein